MRIRTHQDLGMIVAAANYNQTFSRIYREFENDICLKVRNKTPEYTSWKDFLGAGCVAKPSYFLSAVYYMRVELTVEHIHELRDTIFSELYPLIEKLDVDGISLMLRTLFSTISREIMQMELVTFDDLVGADFRSILLESGHFPDVENILHTLPEARARMSEEYERYVSNLINSKSSLWKHDLNDLEYQREIESQFVVNSIKL